MILANSGDHYAPVPYVDPGGQRTEVIGALCGHGLNVRILAQTFLTALIGGDTALTVDVSDLPQKTEGKVNMQTEAASRSQCFISFE